MWLDLQKPSQFTQELKSNLMPNINDTLMHPETSSSYRSAFRWLFINPVKWHWCITGPVEPIVSNNQKWWSVKLLPMSILTYPVGCVHFCYLAKTQHHCLCPIVKKGSPSVCPPTRTSSPPPSHPPPLIHGTHNITGVVKTISCKNQQ